MSTSGTHRNILENDMLTLWTPHRWQRSTMVLSTASLLTSRKRQSRWISLRSGSPSSRTGTRSTEFGVFITLAEQSFSSNVRATTLFRDLLKAVESVLERRNLVTAAASVDRQCRQLSSME